MSTKLKHQPQGNANPNGNNVANLPTRCAAEGCSKKTDVLNFCNEHYEWFKWGLITKQGKKPTDFDKKFIAFNARKKKSA